MTDKATSGANGGIDQAEFVKSLPNIDGRASILTELPDIFVEDGLVGVGEDRVTLTVRWGKPNDQETVRCHPDPARTKTVWCIKEKAKGHLWIIPNQFQARFASKTKLHLVRQTVTTAGQSILWAAPLPCGKDIPSDAAHLEAQHRACKEWTRLEWADMTYIGHKSRGEHGEPVWPDEPFEELLLLGMREHIALTLDHPLLKVLDNR